MMRTITLSAVLLFLASTAPALADDVVLTLEERHGDDIEEIRMMVSEGRLASMNEDGQVTMIFVRESGSLITIDHDDRAYLELNRDNVSVMVDEIDRAMQEMRAQLDQMPPQQREMIEQQMGSMFGDTAEAPPERTFSETDERGSAAGIDCRWYDILEEDRTIGRACVAAHTDVPGGEDMLAMMSAMGEFYEELLSQMAGRVPMILPANPILPLTDLSGLPIRSFEQRDDEEDAIETELLRIERTTVDPGYFEVPRGYRSMEMGMR